MRAFLPPLLEREMPHVIARGGPLRWLLNRVQNACYALVSSWMRRCKYALSLWFVARSHAL
jgi:hypothetical protein